MPGVSPSMPNNDVYMSISKKVLWHTLKSAWAHTITPSKIWRESLYIQLVGTRFKGAFRRCVETTLDNSFNKLIMHSSLIRKHWVELWLEWIPHPDTVVCQQKSVHWISPSFRFTKYVYTMYLRSLEARNTWWSQDAPNDRLATLLVSEPQQQQQQQQTPVYVPMNVVECSLP